VQLLRSSCHLPARTARVARLVASFSWLPAAPTGVASSASSSGDLLRQVRSGVEYFVGMQAPLALRKALRFGVSVLPGNKAPKSDKVKLSCLLQKAQKPRQLHFAPWQRR